MNESITTVFVKQPLALSGSAKDCIRECTAAWRGSGIVSAKAVCFFLGFIFFFILHIYFGTAELKQFFLVTYVVHPLATHVFILWSVTFT